VSLRIKYNEIKNEKLKIKNSFVHRGSVDNLGRFQGSIVLSLSFI
jgi:hypothetical protein